MTEYHFKPTGIYLDYFDHNGQPRHGELMGMIPLATLKCGDIVHVEQAQQPQAETDTE